MKRITKKTMKQRIDEKMKILIHKNMIFYITNSKKYYAEIKYFFDKTHRFIFILIIYLIEIIQNEYQKTIKKNEKKIWSNDRKHILC